MFDDLDQKMDNPTIGILLKFKQTKSIVKNILF